jgi:hypothetical protein
MLSGCRETGSALHLKQFETSFTGRAPEGERMSDDNLKAIERINAIIDGVDRIEHKYLARERDLLLTKWPDYKFLSPGQATLLFAKTYQEIYVDNVARKVDVSKSRRAKGIDFAKLNGPSREFTQLWVARQHADEFTMPYSMYINFCFDFALARDRKAFPRPNQLRANEATDFAWHAEFEKFFDGRMRGGAFRPSDLPQYAIVNYRGLPAQDDVRRYLVDITKLSLRNLRPAIEERFYIKAQVPLEMLRDVYGQEPWQQTVDRLEEEYQARPVTPMVYQTISYSDKWQSCFGVPNARDPETAPCSICPQSSDCKKIGLSVLRHLEKRGGAADPALALKRMRGRERTRKSRARNRAPVIQSNAQSA